MRVVAPGSPRRSRREVFREGDGWAVATRVEVDPARRTVSRRITVFRGRGRCYRRSQERHRVRLHRAPELAGALRRAGFAVRRLQGYGRLRFGPDQAGFAARRR